MKTIKLLLIAPILLMVFSLHTSMAAPTEKPATETIDIAPMTLGQVKKIDKTTGKITIEHQEIVNLDMPAMTMVFRVNDLSMLDQVNTDDKVEFMVEKINGRFVLTRLILVR